MIKKLRVGWVSVSCLFLRAGVALADAPAVPAGGAPEGAAAAAQQPGFLGMIAPFALMFAVFYFLVLRPQKKKMDQQQTMLGALKHGDEVVTNSGLLGKVTGITEKVVTLEIADNVRVKMLKSQIAQVIQAGQIQDLDFAR